MNDDKRFVGTFHNEEELYAKIQELKASGTPDDNIYVIAKNDDSVRMVQKRTDAEVKTTDESWVDKFMNFMTGEDHVHHLFDDLGLSEAEKERYTKDIHDGGLVLYVDEGEAGDLYRGNTDRYSAGADTAPDPNLGANSLTADEAAAAVPPETAAMADPGMTDAAMTDSSIAGGDLTGPAYGAADRDTTADASMRRSARHANNTTGGLDNLTGMAASDVNNEAHLHGDYDHTEDSRGNTVNTERLRSGSGAYDRTTEEVPETMDLHEERLEVDKQTVKKGEVELEKNVSQRNVSTDIPVEHEEVTIERRPVSQDVFRADETGTQQSASFDDQTIRVPVTEEKVEVTKKPVVTEEIVINKKTVTDTEHVDETLRREDVEVNRRGETGSVNVDGDLGRRTETGSLSGSGMRDERSGLSDTAAPGFGQTHEPKETFPVKEEEAAIEEEEYRRKLEQSDVDEEVHGIDPDLNNRRS
ncbi:YsnF/AvaK domain-containing protein [Sporosarcina koreensis]|uniref:YsnF/AvaK domain-containing protein n=1 Tax=Sporosarcina koreensis TaxID=334735 RepID=UPI0006944873|nr:YsnF/AvaK domain-containing protein [Sporosarcina koreensis]